MSNSKRSPSGELRTVAFKICGLAYLIQQQRLDACPPLDAEDISYGIGLILSELGDEVKALANIIEEEAD